MSTFLIVGLIVGLLLVLVLAFNRKAFMRLFESGNAQVGKAGRWAWERDPAAVYQQRVDDATEEINSATRSVEEHKGLVNSLTRQVEDGKREVAILDARIKTSLKDDPTDSKGNAARYCTQLERAKTNLERNTEQHEKSLQMYTNNIKKIQLARQKIKDAEDEGRQLGVELKMAKTEAAINNLATSARVNVKGVDGLSEVAEEMRKQIDKERAKGDVAADLGNDGMAEIEEEERLRKAAGADLLAKYKSEMK
jgi:phage shock protein A